MLSYLKTLRHLPHIEQTFAKLRICHLGKSNIAIFLYHHHHIPPSTTLRKTATTHTAKVTHKSNIRSVPPEQLQKLHSPASPKGPDKSKYESGVHQQQDAPARPRAKSTLLAQKSSQRGEWPAAAAPLKN